MGKKEFRIVVRFEHSPAREIAWCVISAMRDLEDQIRDSMMDWDEDADVDWEVDAEGDFPEVSHG